MHTLMTAGLTLVTLYTTQALSMDRIMMLQMAASPDTTDTAPYIWAPTGPVYGPPWWRFNTKIKRVLIINIPEKLRLTTNRLVGFLRREENLEVRRSSRERQRQKDVT